MNSETAPVDEIYEPTKRHGKIVILAILVAVAHILFYFSQFLHYVFPFSLKDLFLFGHALIFTDTVLLIVLLTRLLRGKLTRDKE